MPRKENTMHDPLDEAPMVSQDVLKMADRCTPNKDLWQNLVIEAKAAGMHQRDARDLLMEYGCPGTTATELTYGWEH
jgi:hypothetical protein